MSNITTFESTFAVQRVLKSGNVQTRGALGVATSGNRAERDALALEATKRLIANNTFAPVVREMVRAFNLKDAKPAVWRGKKGEQAPVGAIIRAAGVGYMRIEANGTCTPVQLGGPIDLSQGCTKLQAREIAESIIARCDGKDVKGEKAFYLQAARLIVAKCEAGDAVQAAAAPAIEAADELLA